VCGGAALHLLHAACAEFVKARKQFGEIRHFAASRCICCIADLPSGTTRH
jgi:hypothetical protein